MKKTRKIISLLLTIQMLLACALIPSAIATDSVIEEPIDVVEALVIDEGEGSEELSPMMARACGQWIGGVYYNNTFLGGPNSSYLDESGSYNKRYFFNSNGYASMVVHYSGHHGHPDPHYHTFSARYNERLGGLCWTESSEYGAWTE